MATETLPRANAASFRHDYEACSIPGAVEDRPPAALQINPDAPPLSLAVSALARANLLHMALDSWCCVSEASVEPGEVAQQLAPTAQEVYMLLDELVRRLQEEA